MQRNQLIVYRKETRVGIPEPLRKRVVKELIENERQIHLPSSFKREMLSIESGVDNASKLSIAGHMVKGLSLAGVLSLQVITVHLSVLYFGFPAVIAYYVGGSTSALVYSIKKTLKDLENKGPMRNTDHTPIARNSKMITFAKFIANFTKTLGKIFPIDNMVANTIDPVSTYQSATTIGLAFCDYLVCLDSKRIMESIGSTTLVPEKTCFTRAGKNIFLSARIEYQILEHFKNALRRFGHIVYQELPEEIKINPSFSWIKRQTLQIMRLVEPLKIPYQIITQQGKFSPIIREIKKTSKEIAKNRQDIEESLSKSEGEMRVIIRSARELYESNEQTQSFSERESEQRAALLQQMQLIERQNNEIKRLQAQLAQASSRTPQTTGNAGAQQ